MPGCARLHAASAVLCSTLSLRRTAGTPRRRWLKTLAHDRAQAAHSPYSTAAEGSMYWPRVYLSRIQYICGCVVGGCTMYIKRISNVAFSCSLLELATPLYGRKAIRQTTLQRAGGARSIIHIEPVYLQSAYRCGYRS